MSIAKWWFIILLICFAEFAFAQKCQIKGNVFDAVTHERLDSVKIEIYEGKLLYKIIFTDTAGRYDTRQFDLYKKLNFYVSRKGYVTYRILFQHIKINTITFIDFNLERPTEEEMKKIQEENLKEVSKSKNNKKRYARLKRF